MASIKLKGDTSGEVTISAPSVAGTTTLELPATSSTLATQNSLGVRNLIINGDMRIDQRNAGSAVTVNANSVFWTVDRVHAVGVDSAGVFTAQQVSDAPDGGDKSLKFTVTTTAASGAYRFHYNVEGNHVAHLGFGQSWAKTFTLSFWVKSSVTGTYCGSFRNSAHNRSYVFEYTIDTANTWERKTITITADTTGTWLTDNGSGLKIVWALGNAVTGTAGSWQSGNYFASANQTNWIATSGATFYISQIQLEVGTEATPFEHRPYDMELARCQRYYTNVFHTQFCAVVYEPNGDTRTQVLPIGTMRASPTINPSSYSAHSLNLGANGNAVNTPTATWNLSVIHSGNNHYSIDTNQNGNVSYASATSVVVVGPHGAGTVTCDAEL